MNKFKVGDTVQRVEDIKRFTEYYPPVVRITNIDSAGNLEFERDKHYWNADLFELYQPEQSEVKPQVEPMKLMQPLVSTYDKALDLRFTHEKLGDVSLREFFCNLLVKLWGERGEFSGKKPWGNSGWDEPVYTALIKAGIIYGELDSKGCIKRCDFDEGSEFISNMIAHAFGCSFSKQVNQKIYDKQVNQLVYDKD